MKKRLLTSLLLIVVTLSLASSGPVDVRAQAGTIYSKLTTSEPDLDGSIHTSEWEDAMCYENVGDDEKFTIYLMHGDEYFYIGLKIKDDTHNILDWISITFDEGDDGEHGSGSGDGVLTAEQEDWKCITGNEDLIDGYWNTTDGLAEFYYPGLGVSIDFDANISYHVDHWEVEFKIPFHGNDGDSEDPSDLNIDVEDAPRVEIDLRDMPAGQVFYPEDADYRDPSTYVELRFDNEPPEISDVSYAPTSPTQYNNVTVSASVTDDVSGLKSVTLLYSTDGAATWIGVNMTTVMVPDTGLRYKASIPKQVPGTTVQFKVSAKDNALFSAESSITSYTVKASIFGMEPIVFYGLILGLVAVILMVIIVAVLMRRPKLPGAPAPLTTPPAPIVAYCPKCGAPAKLGEIYCAKCGKKLS